MTNVFRSNDTNYYRKPIIRSFERVPCFDSNIPWDTSDGETFLSAFWMPK